MASGAPDREGWFVEVRQGFPGVLLGSWLFLVLRWMMPEMVLEDVATRCRLYLAAKPFQVAVSVDKLSSPLHRPTTYGYQTRVQSSLSGTVHLYLVTKLVLREPLLKRVHVL
jgi:hypothetical protein